ncbi:Sulfurtransferase TusD [compost metagenome]
MIAQHGIDAVVCVASALKRGILDEKEALRYDAAGSSLAPGFVISGLGQLVDATLKADRVINFAP